VIELIAYLQLGLGRQDFRRHAGMRNRMGNHVIQLPLDSLEMVFGGKHALHVSFQRIG